MLNGKNGINTSKYEKWSNEASLNLFSYLGYSLKSRLIKNINHYGIIFKIEEQQLFPLGFIILYVYSVSSIQCIVRYVHWKIIQQLKNACKILWSSSISIIIESYLNEKITIVPIMFHYFVFIQFHPSHELLNMSMGRLYN